MENREIERIPDDLSLEEKKEWVKQHRNYPEMTLKEYMMLPMRDEYYDIICSVPRETRQGDRYRLTKDPVVGDLAIFVECTQVTDKLRKSKLAPALDPVDVHGNVPLTTMTMKLKLCWITQGD